MWARFILHTPPGQEEAKPYVEIHPTDDDREVRSREATDDDKARWPREWKTFEEAQTKEEAPSDDNMEVAVPPSLAAAQNIGQDRTREILSGGPISTPASDERAALGDAALLSEGAKVAVTAPDTSLEKTRKLTQEEPASVEVTRASAGQESAPFATDAPPPETEEDDEDGGELGEMTAADAIVLVKDTSDVATLERWRTEEQSGSNRKTVLDAINNRLAALSAP